MDNINTDAATSARASLDVAHWNTLQLFESVPAAEPVAAPCKEGASAAAAAAVAVRGRSMVAASPVLEQRPLHSHGQYAKQPFSASRSSCCESDSELVGVGEETEAPEVQTLRPKFGAAHGKVWSRAYR